MSKEKNPQGLVIPDHEIEALARCLLPEIPKFFDSPEGREEFAKWKAKKKLDNK